MRGTEYLIKFGKLVEIETILRAKGSGNVM